MSTATMSRSSSLAERIARVRNRMLAATSTKISPFNKELFIALCQIYEQHDTEKSSFSSELSDESPLLRQALSPMHEMSENMREQWPERMLRKSLSHHQEDRNDDNDDDFSDWDKAR